MTWLLIGVAFYVSVLLAYCIGCDVGYDNARRERLLYTDLDLVALPDDVQ